jgi:hypothetical protein
VRGPVGPVGADTAVLHRTIDVAGRDSRGDRVRRLRREPRGVPRRLLPRSLGICCTVPRGPARVTILTGEKSSRTALFTPREPKVRPVSRDRGSSPKVSDPSAPHPLPREHASAIRRSPPERPRRSDPAERDGRSTTASPHRRTAHRCAEPTRLRAESAQVAVGSGAAGGSGVLRACRA